MNSSLRLALLLCCTQTAFLSAQTLEECALNQLATLPPKATLAEVRESCQPKQDGVLLPERLVKEKATQDNDFVITPHRQNFVLPFAHNSEPNQDPWVNQDVFPNIDDPIEHAEAIIQISLKVPLNTQDILFANDGLYFGFTMKAFWQVYNDKASRPFRETNYRPEVFYQAPLAIKVLDGFLFTRLGFEHESNGQNQLLSRSWNRVYAGLGFLRNNWAIYLQPWYRLPEDDKDDDGDPLTPPDPDGDDNPDIHRFLGYFELGAVYSRPNYELSFLTRQNLKTGNGAIEAGISFPLWGRIKGFAQTFHGYGDSLIDYDHYVRRYGIGILLTDLL